MRLKVVHLIFGVIVSIALAAQLAMALAFSVSLQRGFGDYLTARDREDLTRLAGAVDAHLAQDPARSAGTDDIGLRLRDAVLESGFNADVGPLNRGPIGPPPFAGAAPPPGPMNVPPPPLAAPPDAGPPDTFSARVLVFDAQGRQIMGPPPRAGPDTARPRLSQALRANGRVLGRIEVLPRRRTPSGVDSRFLTIQYQTAAVISLFILVGCTGLAWLIARIAIRRMNDIRTATQAVANGDFSVTLTEAGAVEVRDTVRNINAMTRALQRLESARRRWLAEVSHELRTPLAALRGELDALLDGVRPMSPAALASLNEEAMRLNALIDDLHLLAVSDLDGPICRFEATDAKAICAQAVERFLEPAVAKGLTLELRTDATTVPVVWDAARMDQVLVNLLTNSLRYTDAPGAVLVHLTTPQDRVRIRVEDSPPSPSAEDLPHLFEPLYRGDAHRSRLHGGSGLGLSVCEAIVRAHAGTIRAAPSPLGGLSITLDLPSHAGRP